jgi:hypothetical protein
MVFHSPQATGLWGGPDWIRSESDRYEVTGKIDYAPYAAFQSL